MLIYNSQISVKEYNRIRLAVGWKELDEEQARIGLENSAYLTVAWEMCIRDRSYPASRNIEYT